MPSSLKLVIGLLGLAVALTVVSLPVQMLQAERRNRSDAAALTGGDPKAGQAAISRFSCGACHVIPGVPRADGQVGPSLAKIATRAFLAGRLPNKPEAMAAWIRNPQAVDPGAGMPNLGVGEKDGRDMAAYLYTLR